MPTPEYRAFVEAGIGVCMAVIMADGKWSQDEFVWWKTVQHRHPLFRDVPADEFNPMLKRVKLQLGSQPWASLVETWAAAVPKQHVLTIFELACELATIDRDVAGGEPDVLKVLWTALGIPDDKARGIFMSKLEGM